MGMCGVFVPGFIGDEFTDALPVKPFDVSKESELVTEVHMIAFLPVYNAHGQAVEGESVEPERDRLAFALPVSAADDFVSVFMFGMCQFVAVQKDAAVIRHPNFADCVIFKHKCVIITVEDVHA